MGKNSRVGVPGRVGRARRVSANFDPRHGSQSRSTPDGADYSFGKTGGGLGAAGFGGGGGGASFANLGRFGVGWAGLAVAAGRGGGGGMNRFSTRMPKPSRSSRLASSAHGVPGASATTRSRCS